MEFGEIKEYEVTVEGETPLLINAFKGQTLERKIAELPPEEQAKERLYPPPKGKRTVHIPALWFQSSAFNAYVASAPRKTKGEAERTIAGRLVVLPEMIDTGTEKYDLRTRAVFSVGSKPGLGSRQMITTPMLREWKVTFRVRTPFPLEEVKRIFDYAGAFFGVGNDRKHGYGRFKVVSIREVTNKQ